MKLLRKLLVLCLSCGSATFYSEQIASGQPPLSIASPVIFLASLQARPGRPVRPVRPVPRPSRPAVRPTTSTRQSNADLIVTDRAVEQRMQQIERQSSRLVERTRRALEANKKSDKLIAKLQRNYGLTFVEVSGHFRLVRYREVIGINLTDLDRIAVSAAGFKRYWLSNLPATAMQVDLLQVPEDMPMQKVLSRLKTAGTKALFTYNTVYMPAGSAQEIPADGAPVKQNLSFRVGMIDTGLHSKHKALSSAKVTQRNFGRGAELTPRNHGTAVASIMARTGTPTLYVADVFSGPILFSDVESIVRAMDWLAGRGVSVINMSLAGPSNSLLAEAVKRLVANGHVIVAAVGNNGKEGEPLYPASYPDVVGVTAVDAKRRIFKNAYQGVSVDYAAVGVKIRAAAIRGHKKYSGTSFASPVIAAFIAVRYQQPITSERTAVLQHLNTLVVDLGTPGRDPIFGIGVLPVP